MSTSRLYGRAERQQGYAAARAVQAMARKLRGRKLSTKEARALTHLASLAAGGSARSAESVTMGRKYKGRKRRRAIRKSTYGYVRSVTGGRSGLTRKEKRRLNREKARASRSQRSSSRGSTKKGSRRLSRKELVARKIQTGRDYVALKAYRAANYGPVPFEMQPSWLRAAAGEKEMKKRARWARRRSR